MYAALAAAGVLAIAVAVIIGMSGRSRSVAVADGPARADLSTLASIESTDADEATASVAASAAVDATLAAGAPVEVPDLSGETVAKAKAILSAAGLMVSVFEDPSVSTTAAGDARIVLRQEPADGELVEPRSAVSLIVPMTAASTAALPTAASGLVVCIDPGHQARSDLSQEPIGPGATETKDSVRGGTTGVVTRIPEYEAVLQISMNLKERLEAQGVKVVMTRTTNDVNISNAERARIANEAGAALFVRVHCDGSTDPATNGTSTLYPGPNQWTGPIVEESKVAAQMVQNAVVSETGSASRGIVPRTDQTGFNWSKVPAITVECGFMSNSVEDKLVTSPNYQDKLAAGMATGILGFLAR